MTFVDEVSVLKSGIDAGNAGPRRAVAEMDLRDSPQRVAVAHRVFRGGGNRCDGDRKNNLRTGFDDVGVVQIGIEREQFLPAASVAEMQGGELPERIAASHSDDGEFPGDRRERSHGGRRRREYSMRRRRSGSHAICEWG